MIYIYADPDASGLQSGIDYDNAVLELQEAYNLIPASLADDYTIRYKSSLGSAFTTALNLSTKTTNGFSLTFEADSGQEALKSGWDTSRARLSVSGSVCVTISCDNVTINSLQIESTSTGQNVIRVDADNFILNGIRTRSDGLGDAFFCSTPSITGKIQNFIFEHLGVSTSGSEGIYLSASALTCDIQAYNGIIYGFDDGAEDDSSDDGLSCVNLAVFGNITDDFDSVANVTNCASDDGSGLNAVVPSDWGLIFSDYVNGDFTVLSTATEILTAGLGPTVDALVPTLDIEGDTRSGAVSTIGPDEFVTVVNNITFNKTTGDAPLSIHADAKSFSGISGGDYLNATFKWNFGDVTGNHNDDLQGFISAHIYETPGTYTLTLDVVDASGTVFQETQEIIVTEFDGTTYYVSSSEGSDLNDGLTDITPFETVTKAKTVMGVDTEILFKRGDTFTDDALSLSGIIGPCYIGAYGTESEPAPVFYYTTLIYGIISADATCENVHFRDLTALGTTSDRLESVKQRGASISGNDITLLRFDASFVAADAINVSGDNIFIFDNYYEDYGNLGLYSSGSGNNLSFVGNEGNRQTGNEHWFRMQSGINVLIANTYFHDVASSKTSIQIRGDGTKDVVVFNNDVELSIGVHPQAYTHEEYVSYVLVDSNIERESLTDPGTVYVPISATYCVYRNNLFSGYISIEDHPLVGVSDNISIYNNTFITALGLILYGNDYAHTNILFKNNIGYSTAASFTAINLGLMDIINELDSDYNIFYGSVDATIGFSSDLTGNVTGLVAWQVASGFDLNSLEGDPGFISSNWGSVNIGKISETSIARDSGDSTMPTVYDIIEALRDSEFSIGAYEYAVIEFNAIIAKIYRQFIGGF